MRFTKIERGLVLQSKKRDKKTIHIPNAILGVTVNIFPWLVQIHAIGIGTCHMPQVVGAILCGAIRRSNIQQHINDKLNRIHSPFIIPERSTIKS